jgi:hypothetical protein
MEWISTKIKEKLPADFQDVLLYQENNGIFIGWLENGQWIVDNTFVETDNYKDIIRGNIKQEEITYWRQLPPNPQWDFFDPELKTCFEWYDLCKKNVKINDFKADVSTSDFYYFWNTEKITQEEFLKRLVNFDIERLT